MQSFDTITIEAPPRGTEATLPRAWQWPILTDNAWHKPLTVILEDPQDDS
jgi:hypothetical protein